MRACSVSCRAFSLSCAAEKASQASCSCRRAFCSASLATLAGKAQSVEHRAVSAHEVSRAEGIGKGQLRYKRVGCLTVLLCLLCDGVVGLERHARQKDEPARRSRDLLLFLPFESRGAQIEITLEHEQKSDGKVLELTELVRQGQSSQQREALSRKDARLYSPFARTEPLRPSSQQSFLQILGAGVCAFLLAPFLLLWRSVLWPYRVVRSVSKHGYRSRQQGLKHSLGYTTATMLRSCWHFATAPLHLFAHAVLDPLGLFTRQPHNYPRLSPLVYVRIFAQQIQRNFLILLRGVGLLAQMLGRFVAAPFLLFASIVLLPWRSLRYGAARNVLGLVASSCAGFWRKARIRSIGFVHALQPRISAVFERSAKNRTGRRARQDFS